jgi:AcrR family transcriptional regulator
MADTAAAERGSKLSRQQRAAQTRARMVQAAHRLFLERGYEATTMQEVADQSAVAVQTVYYTFKTKAQLLAEVEAFTVLGDRPSAEWRQSDPAKRLDEATTGAQLVKEFVAMDADIKARLAPFVEAVGSALPSDPDAVAARERGRAEFFKAFVDRLSELTGLRPGMTKRRALDILLAVNSLPTYLELTTRRGWTPRQWKAWLTDTIERQFLP